MRDQDNERAGFVDSCQADFWRTNHSEYELDALSRNERVEGMKHPESVIRDVCF
jgi:hypothetical protein